MRFFLTLGSRTKIFHMQPLTFFEIKNFKFIKDLKVSGLKKINLLIGKPNTGKSNILEALSVFTLPFISEKENDLIRYETVSNLFYDNDTSRIIKIRTNDFIINLVRLSKKLLKVLLYLNNYQNQGLSTIFFS